MMEEDSSLFFVKCDIRKTPGWQKVGLSNSGLPSEVIIQRFEKEGIDRRGPS